MASTRSDDGLKVPPASPMKQVSGFQPGVVAGVGADQPDPLPGRDPLPHLAAQGLQVHLAVGALHEAGGAEAAAPQAATRHLGEEEVAELGLGRLDDPRGGDPGEIGHEAARHPPRRPVERREAGDPAGAGPGVGVLDLVEPRHVGPRQVGQLAQQPGAGPPGLAPQPGQERRHQLLPLADEDGVEEGGHRLGVDLHGDAAGHHQGVALVAIGGPQREAGPIQELEQVDEVVLEGEREGHHVELAERRARLHRARRAAVLRQEHPLAAGGVVVVEEPVDGVEAEVGHRHPLGVRVAQGHPEAATGVLADGAARQGGGIHPRPPLCHPVTRRHSPWPGGPLRPLADA